MGKFNIEQNKGARLGVMLAVLALIVGVATIWNFNDKHGDDSRGISIEDVIAAYENEDTAKLREYANEIGVNLATLKEIAQREIDDAARMVVLKEREKTLGTWQEAIQNGAPMAVSGPDEDGDISHYYDVTNDGIADFEILYRDDKPHLWRFLDEKGDAYG